MILSLARCAALGLALQCFTACDSDGTNLSRTIPCSEDIDCGSNHTCRINLCVENGSLGEDGTCTNELQCGDGLICYGSVCILGCRDIYHRDDCPDGQWCAPVDHRFVEDSEGFRTYTGLCQESECSPGDSSDCETPSRCLQVSRDVGACVLDCHYTFLDATCTDDCVDRDDVPHSCQVVGENQLSTCLPSGNTTSLSVGEPQCDTISRPCQLGQVCVNVVCRKLCHQIQGPPCNIGESCVSLGSQAELRYCKADWES